MKNTATVTQLVDPNILAPGSELLSGQYTIESPLSSGGFGITYLAKDSLNRLVVIKECFPTAMCERVGTDVHPNTRTSENAYRSLVDLFMREAQNQADMEHPGIASVHQVFKDNNTAYMAVEYIKGPDLFDVRHQQTDVTPGNVEGWLRKTLTSISFIHGKGILHRDLAPDNILVNEKNDPILIDFGAARSGMAEGSETDISIRAVKEGYSPPEFYQRGARQRYDSDLYSLAATFYFLIVERAPASADERVKAISEGRHDPYTPLEGRVDGYSGIVLHSIDKALSVEPVNRYHSADDWLEDFTDAERASTLPPLGSENSSAAPAVKVADKKSSYIVPILLLGLLAVGGAGGYYFATQTPVGPELSSAGDQTEVVVETEEVARTSAAIPSEQTAVEVEHAPIKTIDASTTEDVAAVTEEAVTDIKNAEPAATQEVTQETQPVAEPETVTAPEETESGPTVITAETLRAAQEASQSAEPALDLTDLPITADWVIDLPFTTTSAESAQGTFARVTLVRPNLPAEMQGWLQSGSVIYSINEHLVSDQDGIETRLNADARLRNGSPVSATIRVRSTGSSEIENHQVEFAPGFKFSFDNGLVFIAEKTTDGSFQTRVATIPPSIDTTLKVSDVLRSEALSGLALRDRTAVVEVAKKLMESGNSIGFFTVARKGILESAQVPLGLKN
ncbi:serine/threonine protein kinase [Aliiroseovarius sp. 2305UL8-7]|uniref:serine/threonine protein kinase n=1 Tax=Aliiroseovarius conchicola TaxID=3121637 RepID=UPI00352850C5